MAASGQQNHYAVLGLASGAGAGEIRRAFRRLALRHHPDRAGEASTERFQRIALAYQVLSNPIARSAYDARLDEERRAASRAAASPDPARAPDVTALADLLTRVAGPLETLIARGAARHGDDGIIELLLTTAEAARGGTAAIGMPVRVSCPTCGGCAQPGTIWCVRCEFAGTVREDVTVGIVVPPACPDGVTFIVHVDPEEATPPVRVRVRRLVR